MSLAYLIIAHHKPWQLARLVDRLAAEHVRFYVHVSARTPAETYAGMRACLGARDDVVWVSRVAVRYLGFSLAEATLTGLGAIVGESVPEHTVQLSGQDYPLKPATTIRDALAARAGETLLLHFELPAREWADENGGLDRLRYWHFERLSLRGHVPRLPFLRRRLPPGVRPYGGSAFCALSGEAVAYIVRFARENPKIVGFFRHALGADEMLIHTILLNSPLRDRIANESVHYIEWPGGVHPKTLRSDDLPSLRDSGKLFARKFDDDVDGHVLDLIDRELLAQPRSDASTR